MYHQALVADKSQCQDLSPGSSDPKGHMLFKHFYGSLETTGRIIQGQGLRARGGHQCLTNVKAGRKRVEERKPPGASQADWAKHLGLSAHACNLCPPRGLESVSQLCHRGDSNRFPLSSVPVPSPVR